MKNNAIARRRWMLWGGLAAVGAVVLLLALRKAPVEVDVASVSRGRLAVTLDEEGETRVRERYVVSAPVAGRLKRIELEPGDPVQARTTVLATFVPGDPALLDRRARGEVEARVGAARAGEQRARAESDRARAQLELARSEHTRIRRLAESGVSSQEDLDRAKQNLESAQSTLSAAERAAAGALQELRAAQARALEVQSAQSGAPSENLTLRSPIDGVVLRRLRESEAVVPAGESLLEVGDPANLEIVADYLSADAVRMKPGMPVEIERWGGERPLSGRVRRVEPGGFLKISALGVEEQRVNVIIDFEDPRAAWAALGDGYRVEVRVVTWQADDVVKVPGSALFRQGNGWAVFRVADRRAEIKTVDVGHRGELEAEIRSGVSSGETVIVHPPEDLKPGAKVKVR
ncbi:MAG TPA: HlyD family efflux transporter periplasmic adaptor subunit [Thermoanaerobaculia bacterium]|nr:HlyD family efflux transporter periplasmic adaptor subunit [Thermoanaerobaculia bacterium]